MLNKGYFRKTKVECADNYIASNIVWEYEKVLDLMGREDVREIIFIPGQNKIRVEFDRNWWEIITIDDAKIDFLRKLWDVGNEKIRGGIKGYIVGSSIRTQYYDGVLETGEREWAMATILGSLS